MDALRLTLSRENSPNILKNLIRVIIKTEPIFLNRNIPSYEMNTVVSHFLIMLPLTKN